MIIFNDGEKLMGHFERSSGASITFKSDVAGEITVDWSKVKELHTHDQFAVVQKGTELKRGEDVADIPQGNIAVADGKIAITRAAGQPLIVALANTSNVVSQANFDKAILQNPGLFQDWKGSATVGISLVDATQHSQSYTSSVSLTRILPTESWIDPSSRTSLSFTSSYGTVSQPNTATVKTSIFHADAERDHYFSPRLYGFGEGAFDHDYSQGLNLQQTYGGGVGWTAIKRSNQELDLKAELTFVSQQFFTSASNQQLLGSVFSETYSQTFKKKVVLREQIGLNPAWTNVHDSSGNATLSVSMPLIKRITVTMSTTDNYLEDPSPGFRKNSYQFTTALGYTIP